MSENFREQAPKPTSPRPYHFPDVVRRTLDNGLQVLVARSESAPLISARAVVHFGSDADPAGREGLASITAGLLDEGAGELDALGLAEAVGTLGAFLGAGSDWDASYVWIDVLSRNLDEGMNLFADVVRRPRFEEKEFARIRDDRLTSILQQRDQASAIAANRFSQFVFGPNRYGNPLVGTAETVGGLSREDVLGFYRSHYLPNHTSLIVAGDVDVDSMVARAEEVFGDWERGEAVIRGSIEGRDLDEARIYLVDRPESVQSEIRVGHIGVPRSSEDYIPITVMNAILGEIFNSRIMLNLREQERFHLRRPLGIRVSPACRTLRGEHGGEERGDHGVGPGNPRRAGADPVGRCHRG